MKEKRRKSRERKLKKIRMEEDITGETATLRKKKNAVGGRGKKVLK